MTDDRSDLEEAVRLLREWSAIVPTPCWEQVQALLARHPEKPKLLGCPFCEGQAETINLGSTWIVACRRSGPSGRPPCCAQTARDDSEAEAVAAWNRRAKPASSPVDGGKHE